MDLHLKKIAILFLVTVFSFTSIVPVYAQDLTASEKVAQTELILYGTEQKGSLSERINSLEKDINGSVTNEPIISRIDRAYFYVKGTSSTVVPSLLVKLNVLEAAFATKTSELPAKTRLEALENLINGRIDTGSIDDRMNVLLSMAFPNGSIETSQVTLPKDTLVKISIEQELDSKTTAVGSSVLFRVQDNIYVDGILAIPKGASAHGRVSKVSRANSFGRSGKIEIEYSHIIAIDNSNVPIIVGKLAKEATESMALAAGASIASMVILGPIGIIGGVFVKGKEYKIPKGAVLYVQVKEDVVINGVTAASLGQNETFKEDDVVATTETKTTDTTDKNIQPSNSGQI